jgi:hypothetical protein
MIYLDLCLDIYEAVPEEFVDIGSLVRITFKATIKKAPQLR